MDDLANGIIHFAPPSVAKGYYHKSWEAFSGCRAGL